MVMSKDEFIKVYNENNVRVTGRTASPEILTTHYQYFLEAAEITKSNKGYPVFEKDKDGNEMD